MCHKVCFIAKGYKQIYGQDFTHTTAPTAHLESFHVLLHITAAHNWDAQQFNIKTAYLNGVLPDDEIQYMEQPEGFAEGPPDSVWELHKGLYGMQQSGWIWNKQMHEAMLAWGLSCEWCIYYWQNSDGVVMAAIHVDDILSIASSANENVCFKAHLCSKWAISDLSDVKFALGIGIIQDCAACTINLNQTTLIDCLIVQFCQQDTDPVSTPMDKGITLRCPHATIHLSHESTDLLAHLPYQSLVGCLMYIAIGTCPDITLMKGDGMAR